MNTRLLTLLTTLAFLGLSVSVTAFAGKVKNCNPDAGDVHPSCNEPPPGVVYTVKLTGGPFAFGPVDVSLGSKGNELNGGFLTIIPGGTGTAWDEVFTKCAREMDLGSVQDGYQVSPNDWSVKTNSDNDIHITINGIFVEGMFGTNEVKKEIDFHLDGLPDGRFLPTDTKHPEVYYLEQNIIWGKPWSGQGRAWDTCYAPDHDLWSSDGPTVLTIAIKPPPSP
jgi:hypothetical protein